ncbi:MAG: hypothetical protein KAR87_03245 [Candidatus Aenigmarchaeota archaeon]|nr:hypothetical protein [Candidatus Aenigmarchaeota archaeon]
MRYKTIVKNKKEQSIIAKTRIELLYALALDSLRKKDIVLARNSIKNMIKISRKNKISLKDYNWFFCKKCFEPYGVDTIDISTNKHTKTLDVLCKNCGYVRRKPLQKNINS